MSHAEKLTRESLTPLEIAVQKSGFLHEVVNMIVRKKLQEMKVPTELNITSWANGNELPLVGMYFGSPTVLNEKAYAYAFGLVQGRLESAVGSLNIKSTADGIAIEAKDGTSKTFYKAIDQIRENLVKLNLDVADRVKLEVMFPPEAPARGRR